MPCENCSVQFTVFKRKRVCCECDRFYCSNCIEKGVGLCEPCKILSSRPLGRSALDRLRVRDLQCFLHRQNISTRGCVEKEDLVDLVITHVNSGNFKKRPPSNAHTDFSTTFASIKGFTNNLNNIISSAFSDIGSNNGERSHRRQQTSGSQNTSQVNEGNSGCQPSAHNVSTPSSGVPSPHTPASPPHLITPTQEETRPPVQTTPREEQSAGSPHHPVTTEQPHRNSTTDCIEIEDIDDEWEFLGQTADPLPQDSEELIAEVDTTLRTSARASSEFNLSSRIPSVNTEGETSSLNESMFHGTPAVKTPSRIQINDLKDLSDVEKLSVKQLKELLVLNRVDFKGCCERNELLERATRLWTETTKSREDIEKAPLEELCKICMDAPMECVMLECGHIATCTQCGKRLSECPICRQYVVRVVRFFKS